MVLKQSIVLVVIMEHVFIAIIIECIVPLKGKIKLIFLSKNT